jgi:hypothetical protein
MNVYDDVNEVEQSLLNGSTWHDFHANVTISFGELLEAGFDWGRNDYGPIDDADRTRLNKRIEDHYYYREICATPPGKFKLFLTRKLNEIMPKYKKLYDLAAAGRFDVLRQQTGNSKSRNVYSEYPQTQLQGNADYATNANDVAGANTNDGAPVQMSIQYQQAYDDVDVMILKEIDVCFLSLISTSVNGF